MSYHSDFVVKQITAASGLGSAYDRMVRRATTPRNPVRKEQAMAWIEIREECKKLVKQLADRPASAFTFGELQFLLEEGPIAGIAGSFELHLDKSREFYTEDRLKRMRAIVERTRPEGGFKI